MRFYKNAHAFYCGIDLHARSMFTHILDQAGTTVFERDLPANPDAFRNAIAPYRAGLVVGVECMFAWYWLADLYARLNDAMRLMNVDDKTPTTPTARTFDCHVSLPRKRVYPNSVRHSFCCSELRR
jgi:hypothetical protein